MVDYFLEAYSVENRKARKCHKCCECRGIIVAGEIYKYHHGIGPDGPYSCKMCIECNEMTNELTSHDPDEAIPFEGLGEAVFESREIKDIHRFLNIQFRRGSFSAWKVDYINNYPKD